MVAGTRGWRQAQIDEVKSRGHSVVAGLKWAILLDLDETLVLTSAIEDLRRQRAWQRVYRSLSKTTLPSGTREFIGSAQKLARLGVVTTSPRPYAERLLAHHRLALPVVIAYHDVTRRKPHPEPILKAAEKLQLPSSRCIHVGDLADDIVAAVRAQAIPVGLSWDGSLNGHPEAELARAICRNWGDVLAVISDIVKAL